MQRHRNSQAWLAEAKLYYYKARMYSPVLGRFMQTDPIGYKDDIDLYAYVGNDPVDGTDFSGKGFWDWLKRLFKAPPPPSEPAPATDEIVVTGRRPPKPIIASRDTPQSKGCASGPVIFAGPGAEGYIGPIGGGISGGGYFDTGNGDVGGFVATESTHPNDPNVGHHGFGYGGTINILSVGVARNMSSFQGQYQTISIGYGPISVAYSSAQGDLFSPISLSAGFGINAGPPTPISAHFTNETTSARRLTSLKGC